MNAFAQANAMLHADVNLSEACVYIATDGTRTPCRAIRYQADPIQDLGNRHVRQSGWVFSLPIAAVAVPEKGGKLELGRGAEPWGVMPWHGTREIFDAQLDEQMLNHLLSVR
jgi:hypothetical protein